MSKAAMALEPALTGFLAEAAGRHATALGVGIDALMARGLTWVLVRQRVEILRDLRAQYMIGYYPRNLPSNAPNFHPVRVEMKRPGLQAQTRAGYYGDESR